MSQLSSLSQASHSHDPFWVSIPFVKFSHNTSAYGARNFTWNHVGLRNDLNFVVQSIRGLGEYDIEGTRVVMKISVGVEVLEHQDLGELNRFAKEYDPASGVEHPVQVVVRPPFLAMRYPKANSVRRIQLKFRNDSDFNQVISIMKDHGLPITYSTINPSPMPPSGTVPGPLIPSTSSDPGLSGVTPSPARLSLLPPSRLRESKGSDEAQPSPADSNCFKKPPRPSTGSSETMRSASRIGYPVDQAARPHSTSSAITWPPSNHSTASLRFRQDSLVPQNDQSIYISQIQREMSGNLHSAIRSPFAFQVEKQQQDSQYQTETSAFVPSQDDYLRLKKSLPRVPAHLSRSYSEQSSQQNTEENYDLSATYRPASTPADVNDIHSAWEPPKRNLPFPNPRDTVKTRSSSVSDLLPLPKPTPVTKRQPKARKKQSIIEETKEEVASTPLKNQLKSRVAKRKGSLAPTPQPADTDITANGPIFVAAGNIQGEEPSPLAAKSAAAAPRPSSVASGLQSKVTAAPLRPSSATSALQSKATVPKKRTAAQGPARPASTNKRPKMVDQTTQTQTLSGRQHTAGIRAAQNEEGPQSVQDEAPQPSQDEAPQPTQNGPTQPTAVEERRLSPPQDVLNQIDNFVTKHKARPAPKELWEIPRYSGLDEDQRQIILNNFICDNLDNEDFLTLCEDTGKAWRRIGLGM